MVFYDHIEIMKSKSSLPGATSGWVRCESSSLEDGNGCGAAGADSDVFLVCLMINFNSNSINMLYMLYTISCCKCMYPPRHFL